jgi:Glucodextranase, domain B
MLRVTGTVSEAAAVTIAGKPATVAADHTFDGQVSIASGTSTFFVVATDTNNNIDTNEYEIENLGSSKTFTYDSNGHLAADAATSQRRAGKERNCND